MSSPNSSGYSDGDASSNRYDANTVAKLEEKFKECPYPNETQRREMGEELGLQPNQIKFWYQNKRTHTKNQNMRLQCDALRLENERLKSENLKIKEALKHSLCVPCRGRDLGARPSQTLDGRLAILSRSGINPMLLPTFISSHDIEEASLMNQTVGIPNQHTPNLDHVIPARNQSIPNDHIPVVNQGIPAPTPTLAQDIPVLNHTFNQDLEASFGISNNNMLPQPTEDALMWKIANIAMVELVKLLSMDEPFWLKSLPGGKFILHDDTYQNTFGKIRRLTGIHARVDPSKDSLLVNMGGPQLIEMFLNSEKWVDLFPAIVKKAQTIQVFDSGLLGNRNGALQLMSAEMHIFSNLVPTREFCFLRCCKQTEEGVWAIGDVSVDSSKYKITAPYAWRHPSGCLIQEISEGLCKVTWVEHVEVDYKIPSDELFRDAICENNTYGAQRWVLTLKRMCDRLACLSAETMPSRDVGGVIKLVEGRKSVMNLAHHMVKNFLENLDMQDNGMFPHITRKSNGGETRFSVRENITNLGVPKGIIFCAATSFWIPLSPQNILDILMDNKNRPKWDVLYDGNAGNEMHRFSTGTNPENCISIIWPFIPKENNVMILQERYGDDLGSTLVYAPLDMKAMDCAIQGKDMSLLPLLPSGITIFKDDVCGSIGKPKGSLVTLMAQVLASSSSKKDTIDMKFARYVESHVTSIAKKIKAALNCSDLK